MQGELADASIGEVCRGLASAAAMGTLHVESANGEAAIKLRDGALVAVKGPTSTARIGDRLVHAGLLSREDLDRVVRDQQQQAQPAEFLGELLVADGLVDADAVRVFLQEQIFDALVDVLGWGEGRYHFTRHDVRARPVAVGLSVDRALSEATRRVLESRQVERVLPGPEAHVVAIDDADSIDLEPEEAAVLAALEHGDTVEGTAVRLGFGVRDTARIIWGLRLLGLVDVSPTRRPDRAARPVADPGDWQVEVEPAGSTSSGASAGEEPDEQDILDQVRIDSDADPPGKPRRRRLFGRSD